MPYTIVWLKGKRSLAYYRNQKFLQSLPRNPQGRAALLFISFRAIFWTNSWDHCTNRPNQWKISVLHWKDLTLLIVLKVLSTKLTFEVVWSTNQIPRKLSHDNDPLPVIKKVEKYKEELPPVIKLESPDLLTVEIFTGASSSENVTSPKAERFNPFNKDDNSESSSVRGSTDYEREVSCDSSMRSWADLSYVTEERLKKIKIEDNDADDIVFSAKPKKHKKKRKGMYR